VFDAVISTSTQQNVTPPACSVAGPEVLFTFTLADREVVYLALLDAADPTAAVPAYLELFMGCPPAAGAAVTCGNPAVGERACGRAPFPYIDSGSVLGALTYYVAVRAPAGTTGSWRLHYQHVPASCAGTRITPTETLQTTPAGTTCQQGNNVAPSCAPMNGQDRSFLFAKCPNQALRFTTCGVTAGAAPADSALSAIWGSQTYQATTGSCVPSGPPAAEVACYTLGDATCPAYGARLEIEAQHRPGLVAVSVDTEGVADACGIFILDYRVTSSTSMAP
jgi:hypothetical protein